MNDYIVMSIISTNKKNIDKIINTLFSKHKAVGFEMQCISSISLENGNNKSDIYKVKFRTKYCLLKEIKNYIKKINTDKKCKITYNKIDNINDYFKNRIDKEMRSDTNE